jgi:hypothetical protein
MSTLLDQLFEDNEIQTLLSDSEKRVLLSQVYKDTEAHYESQKVIRLAFLLINHCFSSKELDSSRLNTAYLLLKSLTITNHEQLQQFAEICGINGVDNELLYYFYLSAISMQNDKIINIRIDLLEYSENSLNRQSDIWKDRILNKTLNAFVFLSRKKNGFVDIRKAMTLIEDLKQEQSAFEKEYLEKYEFREEVDQAYSLLGLYHLSKTIVETATYLTTGYDYKKRIDAEIRQHSDVARKLLHSEPRLQSIVSIIEVSLKTICKNSIWAKTSFNDKIKRLCKAKAELGMIDLLPSQREALDKNLLDVVSNVTVLQMPTSAGKSLLAEFNILVTKALRPDAKIVYIVPSRVLVNQVYYDLKSDLEGVELTIEKTTSAIEIDPNENSFLCSEEIDVLVSTPEKLDLLIRRQHPSVGDVSLFVVDEAHTIQNGERGAKLELLLTLLRRERPDAKFMLLSPFIKNAGNTLSEWLGGGNSISIDWKPAEKLLIGIDYHKTQKIDAIKYEILNSPYSEYSTSQTGTFPNPINISSSGKKDQILEFSINHFVQKDKTQLILCRGKKSANNRAKFIYEHMPEKQVSEDVRLIRKFIDDETGRETTLTRVLKKGICTHHAGLSDETKLLLEYLIRKKYISHVCSTTTVAEGVNFPISSIFFDDYRKGDNKLTPNDFWNIAGRAGRTLVDNYGKIILPFNSNANKETAKNLIKESANELVSVLSELFVNADNIINLTENNQIKALFRKYYKSLSPLIQYFVHLISAGGHEAYASEIEDLFKDSFEYYLLDSYDDKEKFIQVCKAIYLYLQKKYGSNTGILSFADKTGFSVPSVIKVMTEKSLNPNIADLESWQPKNLFDSNNLDNLTDKIKVIAALRETEIGTKSDKAQFNPEIIAKILIAWVKGEKLDTMSKIHPYYASKSDDNERINDFVQKMNDIRFKSSWGLSALEGIVKGNEKDIKDTYVPSFAYYGVDNEKSLALRMVGVPRELSGSLSQIIEKDISSYSFNKIRKMIRELQNSDWDNLKPGKSSLTGEEWKSITEILIK